jgi:hypothetical protein
MNNLPKKFIEKEKYCYQWLYDCGIRGWTVDLKTKEVYACDKTYKSLIEFAKHEGLNQYKGDGNVKNT